MKILRQKKRYQETLLALAEAVKNIKIATAKVALKKAYLLKISTFKAPKRLNLLKAI